MTGFGSLIIHLIGAGALIKWRPGGYLLALSRATSYNRPMSLPRLSFLLALIAALALPVEATAGLLMTAGMAVEGGAPSAMTETTMATMPDDCPLHGSQKNAAPCVHCPLCQLTAGGFIYAVPVGDTVLPAVETYVAVLETAPASHIPEPPLHPPKRSL